MSATAYIGVSILASALGVDWQQSLWSNYERMMGLWTLLHVFFFFIVIATSLREEDFRWLFRAIVLSAAILALFGLGEIIAARGAARIESTLKNSAFLASYLFLAGFLALMLAWQERAQPVLKYVWLSISLVSFFAMVSTGTRGAMIALGASTFLILFLSILFSPWGFRVKRFLGYGVAILVMIIIIGYFSKDWLSRSSFDPLARLASVSSQERTVEGRLLAWRVAWTGWRERFFLGWGIENFSLLFNAHYDPRLYEQEPWFDRAHNFILDIGATTGILGLVAYLMIFVSALVLIRKKWRRERISFGVFAITNAILVGHLLQNFFVFDSITSLVTLWVVFAWIHAGSIDTHEQKQYPGRHWWVLIPGAVLAVALVLFVMWRPLQENRLGKAGYDAFAQRLGDERAMHLYENALAYNTFGDVDVRRSVAEYLFEFMQKGGKRDPQALRRVIDYAIQKMEENIKERPSDVKWYMYQGQLYNLGAAFFPEVSQEYAAYAEKRYLESAELSPGRPQIYLEIAQARSVLKNIPGVWEAMDTAERLAPDYGTVYINGIVHAIALGDRQREAQYMAKLTALEAIDAPVLRDAYYKVGRLDETIAMENRYIQRLESQSDASKKTLAVEYKNLAVFHKEAGHIPEARGAALKVIELDPSQRPSAEVFLQLLGG